MTGRDALGTCLLWVLTAVGPGCPGSIGLEVRDCSVEELAFIDAGVVAAETVVDIVGPQLARRHPDEEVTYDEILGQVRDAREDGRIRCAEHTARVDDGRELAGITGYADMGRREIVLNTGHPTWRDAFGEFLAYQGAPPMDDQTLAKRLAGSDRVDYEDVRRQTRSRLLAPATPALHLVHEAAHLATGTRYPHTAGNADDVVEEPDFVVHAGYLTFDALCWQVWLPEARRIDGIYFDD